MSSVNDTHSVNDNYFSVNDSIDNTYSAKQNQSRNRACSSSKVEKRRKISNVSASPSKNSTCTSPPVNFNYSHSYTSSIHSDQSSNFKYKIEISESPPSSPHLKASHSNNSIGNHSKQNIQKNSLILGNIAENDVTSQLSSSYSSSIPSNTNSSFIANSNNKNNNNDNSFSSPPSIQQKMREILRDNRNRGRKMSFTSSLRDRETFHHRPSSSDLGNYHITGNGLVKPKSSISYQVDSSTKTLNCGSNLQSTINNQYLNTNSYNPNNYLTVNSIEHRKKYSSCYSISSNSTALAPPKKYLNHNYSISRYPKIKHMLYVFLIMFIIYILNFFATYSTRWIVVNTSKKFYNTTITTEESVKENLLYHFEFGMFTFCYKTKMEMETLHEECDKISKHCPTFCTEYSCIDFNPENDGKILDSMEPEDSRDPKYSFCQLTALSRKIAIIYTILNTLNIIIAILIIITTMKYRGNEKGKLKSALIKKLSYISDRYSYKYNKSKLKNSDSNIASNNTSNMELKIDNNLPFIGFHYQYNEPEAIDIDESEQEQKKISSNNIINNNNTVNSNSTNRITYHIPASTNNIKNDTLGISSHNSTQIITPEYIEEQNRIKLAEEEQSIRRKRILKILFGLLICISTSLSIIGVFFIFKWAKERDHIGMSYLKETKLSNDEMYIDTSIGVSLILVSIATVLNVILALYLIGLFSVVHFSRSKTYWNNESDEDTYSQSYDGVHPSSSYNPSYGNNFYGQNNSYNSNVNTYIP